MGTVTNNCKDWMAAINTATVLDDSGYELYFNQCPAYQIGSSTSTRPWTWEQIVDYFYGSAAASDSVAVSNLAWQNKMAVNDAIEGAWVWFSQYLYGSNGTYSFSCANVFPPCSNINVDQLYGVQGDNQPANEACGY
ncbi:hypothetical protein [Sulfobacillus harzensis]|uniref:Uncharacterized protein n=1 Tax=Sulfobacillus harzensis TaxID=2729629 RepID=A0A7Y0L8W4_9FIRM|nr:hypothetical protein [Sulfobacillus harzensis]NMP24054.1 hypothetical protein [Sulfobacillus harzensis]